MNRKSLEQILYDKEGFPDFCSCASCINSCNNSCCIDAEVRRNKMEKYKRYTCYFYFRAEKYVREYKKEMEALSILGLLKRIIKIF